jgi:hypothetical protein
VVVAIIFPTPHRRNTLDRKHILSSKPFWTNKKLALIIRPGSRPLADVENHTNPSQFENV